MNDAGEAEALVGALGAVPRGELRLSVAGGFGLSHVVPLIAGFLAAHPEVSVKLALDDAVALDPAAVDLTIRLGPPDPGCRTLARFRRRLVAAPRYLQQRGRPLRIDDLPAHDLLHEARAGEPGVWRLRAPTGELREVRASGRLAVSDPRALCEAAVAGLGVAQGPGFLAAGPLGDGRLEAVLDDLPPEPEAVLAQCPGDLAAPPKVRAFLDHLETGLAARGAAGSCNSRATTASTRRLARRPASVAFEARGAR